MRGIWIAGLFLAFGIAALSGTTGQVIYVDVYRGITYSQQGTFAPPLYEATFQILTKQLGSFKGSVLHDAVGAPVTWKELPELEPGQKLCFWTDEYIGLPPYPDDFLFGCTLLRCSPLYPDYFCRVEADYTLIRLPPHGLLHLAWADATGRPQWAVRRAYVQQIGRLKVLAVIRGVLAYHLSPWGGDFLVDIWVTVFPADVDIIFQASRYPMWP